jgi:SWI/SNF-related matrix-associated actin-dependent regulator 1 of chromatin subfamily A
MRQLFDYQKAGVNFLASNRYAGLFDEPGLGKTTQAAMAWRSKGYDSVLVICPASVRLVWPKEVAACEAGESVVLETGKDHPSAGKVNVCSYDYATRHRDRLAKIRWRLLVLDEAHFLKNPKAARTKAVYGPIAKSSECVWALTGTPMPNNPTELYPMLKTLFPSAITRREDKIMTYWQFVNRYCVTRNNGYGIEIVKGKNLDKLRDSLRGYVMRRKVKTVLKDLPPIRYDTLPVSGRLAGMPDAEREVVERAMAKGGDLLESLQKVALHVATLRRMTGLAKVDGVLEWLRESEIEKAVLFAQHKDVILGLMSGLEKCVGISGDTSPAEREKAVSDFQNGKANFFVGQLQAAGTGITLTAANTVIFVESSWVPAENEQAAKRIHRIGQEKGCIAYFATIPGSLDERIQAAVARKTADIAALGL